MGKKRKQHPKLSPEEHHRLERTERYNKLHHACSKQLHREAKVVKSFECQKVVRAIKAAREQCEKEEDGAKASKLQKRVETLQQKLERTKQMELDAVAQAGLRRLGVLSLDPREGGGGDGDCDGPSSEAQSGKSDANASSQSEDPFYQRLLETMLRHKRLSAALDQLNEKVTDYRQWTMQREAMLRGDGDTEEMRGKGNKRKKNQRGIAQSSGNDTLVVAGGFHDRKRGPNLAGHEGASGLFIGSLSGLPAADDDGEMDEYGDDDAYDPPPEKKKNRPGQRARRAKALALEAKKAGRTWGASINWREKKADRRGEGQCDAGNKWAKTEGGNRDDRRSKGKRDDRDPKETAAKTKEDIAQMGKTWKEEGQAHPSWAAAAAQKSTGIAEFKGTKITFD
ncbi:hypothetical protein ACHAXT_000688 [Thalassiosira profunda]